MFPAALAALLAVAAPAATAGPVVPEADRARAHSLLPVLADTMRGALEVLDPARPAAPDEVRPSLITYSVGDVRSWNVSASFGALTGTASGRDLRATIRMRVGDRKLDNTHHVAGDRGEGLRVQGSTGSVALPLDAGAAVVRRLLEDETDKRFARAVSDLGAVKAAMAMVSAPEDDSPDLSEEEPQVSIAPLGEMRFDPAPWHERLRRVSAVFRAYPGLLGGDAWLRVGDEIRLTVTSEGTLLQRRSTRAFAGIQAWVRAADGAALSLQWDTYSPDPARLPEQAELERRAAALAERVLALESAPSAEPYVGPLLIEGRAAGVLFHEVLGHPLEGERQRDEKQAQTFKGKVGERILPEFLSITFDPTLRALGGVPLGGAYDHDDEGVKARPVVAVEKGVLRSFLLSRRPIRGFPRSNGHGRTEGVPMPVARQSNLLVQAAATLPEAELRRRLVEIARGRGLEYGLWVTEVQRGATRTSRGEPNAFNVVPVEVFRVFVDGRPDQLIRNAELVGTPLAALGKIVAAGDRIATFNGVCGAESGWVPVSASSPAILLEEIEVQRGAKSSERRPILPPPAVPGSKP